MTETELTSTLHELADAKYRNFAASLIPGENDLLGVRLPDLRKLAKKAADENWQVLFSKLKTESTMELVMLRGMLPGYAKNATLNERLAALTDFIPSIRNWSICDSCCATYRFAQEHRTEVLDFIRPYLISTREFEARFGVVMLLNHYLPSAEFNTFITKLLPQVTCSAHYAQMGVAWCACDFCLRNPESAKKLLRNLSPAQQLLTLRKLRESKHSAARQILISYSNS